MGNNHTFLIGKSYGYNGAKTNPSYTVSENFDTYSNGVTNFRKGIRDGKFVIDKEIYDGGFLNTQNIGWTNLITY